MKIHKEVKKVILNVELFNVKKIYYYIQGNQIKFFHS